MSQDDMRAKTACSRHQGSPASDIALVDRGMSGKVYNDALAQLSGAIYVTAFYVKINI